MMSNLPFATFVPVGKKGGNLSAETPTRIVIDSINTSTPKLALASYTESGIVPHFTISFGDSGVVMQHLDLSQSAVGVSDKPIEPHLIGRTIWVMIVKPGGKRLCISESFLLGQTIGAIAEAIGVSEYYEPFPAKASVEYRNSEMSLGAWNKFEGICGAAHVPICSHFGPGEMDLESFGEGLMSPDAIYAPNKIVLETIEAAVKIAEPTVTALLSAEFAENTEDDITILGEFPGRRVQLGSGGKAVDVLRNAYRLDEGKFDEELLDCVIVGQKAAGLTADGIVDSTTWTVLDQLLVSEN